MNTRRINNYKERVLGEEHWDATKVATELVVVRPWTRFHSKSMLEKYSESWDSVWSNASKIRLSRSHPRNYASQTSYSNQIIAQVSSPVKPIESQKNKKQNLTIQTLEGSATTNGSFSHHLTDTYNTKQLIDIPCA